MRITMRSVHNNILGNLNDLTVDLDRINKQISSGKQMSKISDDPVSLVTALGLRTNITEINQYQENIQFGDSMITASESSLTQMKSLAITAKTLAIQMVNAPVSAENRTSAAGEVKHLWEEAIMLGNTEVGGKYVFGGYRTAGYTAAEPEPFIADLIDGYQVNGTVPGSINQWLSGTIDNTPPADLAANDLLINGTDIGAVVLNAAAVNGLNMTGASNLKTAINAAATTPSVTANLTTLYAGAAATAEGGFGGETMTQSINGTAFNVVVPSGATAAQVATLTVAAINGISAQTGVSAVVGDATNGGVANSVVLSNSQPGDETDIVVGALVNANANTGLAPATYSVGAANNTGQISLNSSEALAITTSAADDTILDRIGLGAGGLGFADVDGDGSLTYGAHLTATDLTINGTAIGATTSDTISTVYSDASAAAKATAINALESTTGVHADITPATITAGTAAQAGTIRSGDLVINGIDIFDGSNTTTNPDPATVIVQDTDNVLLNGINAKSGQTGVFASRDSNGKLILTAIDGRNIQVTTTGNGENITHLNGAAADTPASKVYFGSLQLTSDNQFILESPTTGTAPTIYEAGLDAIGLSGGGATTGESKDVVDDGRVQVITIMKRDGSVRYAGDRDHDLSIKVGQSSTLDVTKNGKTAVMDTNIFSALKDLEDALLNQKLSTVTGVHKATDTTATLDSKKTGLEQDFLSFTNGTISVTITDHNYYPARNSTMDIGVDITTDTPSSIAAKLHGIPGLTAAWDANGQLKVETSDTDRYTFTFTDTSNTMALAGITSEQMQIQAIDKTIGDMETVMENLTTQISDFGARANRILVQNEIYLNLELATKENLSEKEDTDLTKALMEMKAKELAYEAALSSAAKTMQLSLVNFLN